jgi:medium-chain acyl-[acyl-carrier-protein] hydrolase
MDKRPILFCFPYAGGSSAVFSSWKQIISPAIELYPVELAGRGRRIGETMYAHFEDLLSDMLAILEQQIQSGREYALFGHSLGASIVYNIALRAAQKNLTAPIRLFISGRGAPHIKRQDEKIYHRMSDLQFEEEVLKLGGTVPEVFLHKELRDLFLPLLKNDFKLAETIDENASVTPFDQPITVFQGIDDDLTTEQREGWKLYSRTSCNLYSFPGGHFFLNEHAPDMIRVINESLN